MLQLCYQSNGVAILTTEKHDCYAGSGDQDVGYEERTIVQELTHLIYLYPVSTSMVKVGELG